MARGRHFTPEVRAHRTNGQRALVVLGCVATLACFGTAVAARSVYGRLDDFAVVEFEEGTLTPTAPGVPENFLIVGSDSRAEVDPTDEDFSAVLPDAGLGCNCADTLIVARIDPATLAVDLLSLPRDLWVTFSDDGRERKINAAYERGPQVVVDTVSANLGIEINHYLEIDFVGFQRMISAVGGVPIFLESQYRDPHSGLEPIGPGCVTLDGPTALALSRSRFLEYRSVDGTWRYAHPLNDYGRVERQQIVLQRALQVVLAQGIFDPRNVLTLNELLGIGVDSVTLDAALNDTDTLVGLGRQFRALDARTIGNHTLPTTEDRSPDGQSILRLDEDAARPVLNLFRGLDAESVPYEDIPVTVSVAPGLGDERSATEVAAALEAVGFASSGSDVAVSATTTTIRYPPGAEEQALLLARHLTTLPSYLVDDSLAPGSLVLEVGTDFTTVSRLPWPADAVPHPAPLLDAEPVAYVRPAGPTQDPTPPPAGTTATPPTTAGPGAIQLEPPAGIEC